MEIPGFKAEASLYRGRHAYYTYSGGAGDPGLNVVMQQLSCQDECLLAYGACALLGLWGGIFGEGGCMYALWQCGQACPPPGGGGGGEVQPPPPVCTQGSCPRGLVCCDCTGTCLTGAQCSSANRKGLCR